MLSNRPEKIGKAQQASCYEECNCPVELDRWLGQCRELCSQTVLANGIDKM